MFTDGDFCKCSWAHVVISFEVSWHIVFVCVCVFVLFVLFVLFKCTKTTAIRCWFPALYLAHRNFSRESFDDMLWVFVAGHWGTLFKVHSFAAWLNLCPSLFLRNPASFLYLLMLLFTLLFTHQWRWVMIHTGSVTATTCEKVRKR